MTGMTEMTSMLSMALMTGMIDHDEWRRVYKQYRLPGFLELGRPRGVLVDLVEKRHR